MATTLLRKIARRCIADYEGISFREFRSPEVWNAFGYCSERMVGVLLEEALDRKPSTMGLCIAQATQDWDLEQAFIHLEWTRGNRQYIALDRLRYDFMVVLAHEIKSEIQDRASRAPRINARS